MTTSAERHTITVDYTIDALTEAEARPVADSIKNFLSAFGSICEKSLKEYYKFPNCFIGQVEITTEDASSETFRAISKGLDLDEEATYDRRTMGNLERFPKVSWLTVSNY